MANDWEWRQQQELRGKVQVGDAVARKFTGFGDNPFAVGAVTRVTNARFTISVSGIESQVMKASGRVVGDTSTWHPITVYVLTDAVRTWIDEGEAERRQERQERRLRRALAGVNWDQHDWETCLQVARLIGLAVER